MESIGSVGLLRLRPRESTLLRMLLPFLLDRPRNIRLRLTRPWSSSYCFYAKCLQTFPEGLTDGQKKTHGTAARTDRLCARLPQTIWRYMAVGIELRAYVSAQPGSDACLATSCMLSQPRDARFFKRNCSRSSLYHRLFP